MAAVSRDVALEVGAEGLGGATLLVTVEASYTRSVPSADTREKTTDVSETRQFILALPAQSSASLDAVAVGSQVELAVFADERTNQVTRTLKLTDNAVSARIVLTAAELKQLRGPRPIPAAQPSPMLRTAQFVSIGTVVPNFTRSALNVAAVKLANGGWASLGLDDLFQMANPVTTSVEWGQAWPQFGSILWTPVHLAIDGRFSQFFAEGAGDAWLWWLNGSQSAVGIVLDDLSVVQPKMISIPLPAFAVPPAGDREGDCGCDPKVRTDVNESELVNNPDVYAEDPGAFCKPFSNPERILSERPFYSLFRVEQPVVSPEPTGKLDDAVHFDFEVSPKFATRALAANPSQPAADATQNAWNFENIYVKAASLPALYTSGLATINRGRTELNASHPVQWEGDATRYQATTAARGHILEYRVRWRSNGYSLGTVAKTLTLAPRQVRRIQKIDWARTETARRVESTQFAESASDRTDRERQYDDAVQSSLSEWARGESSASQTGVAGGIGFAMGPVVIGGGAAHSNASSSSSQQGGRAVSATEEQNLRDSIRRFGDSLRRLDSVVVTEVTQQETVTGTTEIIRNANYAHSLTVIYYQILRHLKVDTEFAGVRECLFVPFAMKPFTLQRIYRWRETLQKRILDRKYLYALQYLKDVMNNFVGSSVPPDARCDMPLVDLHGSIYINLGIERPKDATDSAFDASAWRILGPFLGLPALNIFSQLSALQSQVRDAIFQRDHAPTIAAKWVDTLQLLANGVVLDVDFTMATAYRFNNTVRVDFTANLAGAGLTRRTLSDLTVKATKPLTPGSVANFVRAAYTYQTSSFERTVSINKGINDLVLVDTGAIDTQGAHVVQVPDFWELQNLRAEITLAVHDLLQHLNEHVEHYHKVIWWYMDRDRLFMLLDGFYVPGTPGVSIASVVEREPIAIVGNALVFRVSAGSFLGWGIYDTPEKLYNYYWGNQPARDPLYVSLPTDGLYAQTIMDECLALEEHKGDLDWVLDDIEPALGEIDPSLLTSRNAPPAAPATPSPLPSTLINLQNAPAAPDPVGLAGVLGAVTNANAFRDMAGLAGTQAGAQAALTAAAGLATNFGNQAAAIELAKTAKADQATKSANQKLASIKNAKDKGLTDDATAAQQAKDVLSSMNPDSNSVEAPHQNPAITSAIEAAKGVPGSTVEASTAEGSVKVALGDPGIRLASLSDQTIKTFCAFFGPGAVAVSEQAMRDAIVKAAVDERALWFDAAGNVIREDANSQFGHLVRYWLGRYGDVPPNHLAALQAKAIDGTVNYGLLRNAGTSDADVNTEVTRVRTDLMTAAAGAPAVVRSRVESSVRNARDSGVIMPEKSRTAWSAIFVSATVRKVAVDLGIEAMAAGVQEGRNGLLLYHDAHRVYVADAFRRRRAGIAGTYHAFDTTERAVEVGDIIVQDRQAGAIGDVWKFADIPALATTGRQMHCDIVTEVTAGSDHVVTIGGNLGNSARNRAYPVDADGKLVVNREQDYVQENDAGVLPAIPATNVTAGLRSESTGRIFALLSPMPLCVAIPGQRLDDGSYLV
jgi:hypothetical protein